MSIPHSFSPIDINCMDTVSFSEKEENDTIDDDSFDDSVACPSNELSHGGRSEYGC